MGMISVTSVPVPRSLDTSDPDSRLFTDVTEVMAMVQEDIWGSRDLAFTAQELWARGRYDASTRHDFYAVFDARSGTRPVAAAWAFSPLQDNTHLVQFRLAVLPEARRRGIGSAILDVIEERAAAEGRSTAMCFSEHPSEAPASDPTALIPPTGFGRLPASDPGVRFLVSRDFSLEQSSRHAVLAVPPAEARLGPIEAAARKQGGGDYGVRSWHGDTPPELRDMLAELMVVMSLEAPEAGLDVGAEEWTAQRLIEHDRRLREARRTGFMTVAQEKRSGQLVGYTIVECIDDAPIGFQQDTLVLPAHRGHRLGWWLKTENIRQIAAHRPDILRLHTWNAEENGPMLAINDALGFTPSGAWASWQRRLA